MKEKLNSKKLRLVIIYFMAIALFLIFKPKIEVFLSKLDNSFTVDHFSFKIGYVILCFIVITWYVFIIEKKYIFNPIHNLTLLLIGSFYGILRFGYDTIVFLPPEDIIKYLDVLFFVLLLHGIALYLRYKEGKSSELPIKNDPIHFIEDIPLVNEVIDNEYIVDHLITTIKSFTPKESYSIGVNAVWGYGKSTFLKRFEYKVKESNPETIVFWYHLWKNKGESAIIENFFAELKKQLAPYSGNFSSTIDKYVDAVVAHVPDVLQKIVASGKSILFKDKTLEEYYNVINKGICQINRQIIVLLDDLDRLDEKEILQSFKLIRTLADFNNVIFIAGYHRQYITNTIGKNKQNYIDKIFNVEIDLLPFNEKRIEEELILQVKKSFPVIESTLDTLRYDIAFENLFITEEPQFEHMEISLENSSNSSNILSSSIEITYRHFLLTFRDIKRFINEFKFNAFFLESKENVVFKEYILLKLCTYKYRVLQSLIFNRLDVLLTLKNIDGLELDSMYEGLYGKPDIYIYDQKAKDKVSEIISKNEGFNETDFELIDAVLIKLFGEKTKHYYNENQNCIAKISYTNIYIRNNIAGALFKISDFQKAFENNTLNSFLDQFKSLTRQSLSSAENELKLFIFRSNITDKKQFFDVFNTINGLSVITQSEDRQSLIILFNEIMKKVYDGNKQSFLDDFKQEILSNSSIGTIDWLLNDINKNEKRSERPELYTSTGIIRYENDLFDNTFLKEILIAKFQKTIESNVSVSIRLSGYHLYTEKIVVDHRIIRSKQADELIKSNITKPENFDVYLKEGFFDFSNSSKERSAEYDTHEPWPFLDQMFSNPKTLDDLLADPLNEKLYIQFSNEGWDNYYKFLAGIENPINDKGNYANERLEKNLRLLRKFIEKGYKSLTNAEYETIINSRLIKPPSRVRKNSDKGKY
ncbi:P-loop NTPase fold protein [Aquimarina sp. 433]